MDEETTTTIIIYGGTVVLNVIVHGSMAFFRPDIRTCIAMSFGCALLVPGVLVGLARIIYGPDPFYIIGFLNILWRTWYISFVVGIVCCRENKVGI